MAYVVSRLCRDCVHTACVSVCPVECFYRPKLVSEQRPNQLYISPDECINCGACLPVCPWEAIYDEPDVPRKFAEDVSLNALCDRARREFVHAEHENKPDPKGAQVAANKKKWGL